MSDLAAQSANLLWMGERPPLHSLSDFRALEAQAFEARFPARTVSDILSFQARTRPDAPALIWLPHGRAADEAEIFSYARIWAEVLALSARLKDFGVCAGRPVSLLLPNGPDAHLLLWAGALAGGVNPINPHLEAQQIAGIVKAAASSVLVTASHIENPGLADKAKAVLAAAPALAVLACGDPGEGETALRPAKPFGLAAAEPPPVSPDDTAALLHTGGTTGTPKLVRQTHLNQAALAQIVAFTMGWGPQTRVLTGLPLFHNNAALISGLSVFASGGAVVLAGAEGFRAKATIGDVWRIVDRYRVTAFCAVPTILAGLLGVPVDTADISSLRDCICGAAPLAPSLYRAFEDATGIRVTEGYGLTEGTAVSTVNPPDGERRIGSIGLPLPYHRAVPAVLDGNGRYIRDCRVDEIGTLLISGVTVTPGYSDGAQNAGLWAAEGWLNTGDLARRDADGYLWLAGRAKDLIIRGGHNIDPTVIEAALSRHPAVDLAAAVGRPDAYAGELPMAYVTLKPGGAATAQELVAFARDHTPERAAAPVEIVILQTLPLTAVGKVFKPRLRQMAAASAIKARLAQTGLKALRVRLDSSGRNGLTAIFQDISPFPRQAVEAALFGLAVTIEVETTLSPPSPSECSDDPTP